MASTVNEMGEEKKLSFQYIANEREKEGNEKITNATKMGEKRGKEVMALEGIIKKVKGMTDFGSKAFKYAFDEHLEIVDVTWEDCARDKGSIWGYVLFLLFCFSFSDCRL